MALPIYVHCGVSYLKTQNDPPNFARSIRGTSSSQTSFNNFNKSLDKGLHGYLLEAKQLNINVEGEKKIYKSYFLNFLYDLLRNYW